MADDQQSVTAEQVALYLTENTDFFNLHPEVIESLVFNDSPQGTISLSQRQNQRLQLKNEHLHQQLQLLIENARENTHLQLRVHQLCLRLMDAPNLHDLLSLIINELKSEFNADQVSFRWFYAGEQSPDLPELNENIIALHADDSKLSVFDKILSQQQPVCGRLSIAQKTVLFPHHSEQVKSVACIPLGHEPCAGLLAIASYDEDRFHADIGTDYLSFLGDVVMRVLRPYHDYGH